MDYYSLKGKFGHLKANKKGQKSSKPKMPCPPKLICMHLVSPSTCMNFLSQFYFLTPMDYMVWKNVTKIDGKQISKTVEPTPTTCMSATYTCMSLTVRLILLLKQHSQAALQF